MGLAPWGRRRLTSTRGCLTLRQGCRRSDMCPLLLVNTWSHEEESHARCHKHQVGHSVIRSRRVPATVRRLPLSAGGRMAQHALAPTRVRLRLSRLLRGVLTLLHDPVRDRARLCRSLLGTPTSVKWANCDKSYRHRGRRYIRRRRRRTGAEEETRGAAAGRPLTRPADVDPLPAGPRLRALGLCRDLLLRDRPRGSADLQAVRQESVHGVRGRTS